MFGYGYNNIFGNEFYGFSLSKKKRSKLSAFENDMEFTNWLVFLFEMAMSIFIWDGLPETCSARFLEQSLILRGQAVFTQEENGAHLTLGAAPTQNYNIYGEPLKCFGWGLNGYNKQYSLYVKGSGEAEQLRKYQGGFISDPLGYDGVLCWDNKMRYPYINYIITAAKRLADTERSCDVIARNLKQSVAILCPEEMKDTVNELFASRDNNETLVIGNGKIMASEVGVIDLKVNPDAMRVMYERFDHHLTLIHSIFGIESSAQSDKRERLLVDEVNANNQITAANLQKRLHMREDFCELVNKAFDLNISVKVNPELFQEAKEEQEGAEITGGNENRREINE